MEKRKEFDDRYNPEEERERNRLFHLDIDDTREELDSTAEDARAAFNDKLLRLSVQASELSGEMVSHYTKIENLLNQRARFVRSLEETTDESEKRTIAQRITSIDSIIPKIRAEIAELEAELHTIKPEYDAKAKMLDSDHLKN